MKRILILCILFLSTNLYAQEEEPRYLALKDVDYSLVKLGLLNSEGLNPFFDSCKNAQVVYSGENHLYIPFNNLISFTILNELNTRHGFKDYIIELGPARSQLINEFLKGDSMAALKLKASSSYSHFTLYESLKAWNDVLVPERKITAHGIDVERFNEIPLMNIGELFENRNTDVPNGIEPLRNSAIYRFHRIMESGLKFFAKLGESYYGSYTVSLMGVKQIIFTSDSLSQSLKAYFGEEYDFFKEQIGYLKEYVAFKEYKNTPLEHNWRETHMFKRLNSLIQAYPEKQFYGQFGRCHSIRTVIEKECDWYAFKSTMERIAQKNPGIKTVSMGMFYGKNRSQYYDKKYRDLVKYAPSEKISLFNLKPFGIPTRIASQFDFALVNDQMLSKKVSKKSKTRRKYEGLKKTYSFGLEAWLAPQSGMTDIYALDSLEFTAGALPHLGIFAHVNLAHRISSEMGFSWAIGNRKDQRNKVALDYRAKAIRGQLGYALIQGKKGLVDIHAGGLYTVQKLRRSEGSDSLFGTQIVSNFRNQDVLLTGGITMQYNGESGIYLALSGDYTSPLMSNNEGWSLDDSAPGKHFGNPKITNEYASPFMVILKLGIKL